MGIMDQLGAKASSTMGQNSQSGKAIEMVSQLLNQSGGIQGLVSQLHENGLGHLVQSWIGTGANMPISAEQLASVVGQDKINAIAEKAGIAPSELQQKLSLYLPKVIDLLTPNGQLQSNQFSMANMFEVGKKLFQH
jgi:uncharacterized protein YidB (DUF937 family)